MRGKEMGGIGNDTRSKELLTGCVFFTPAKINAIS
jgi:hypothetical protein